MGFLLFPMYGLFMGLRLAAHSGRRSSAMIKFRRHSHAGFPSQCFLQFKENPYGNPYCLIRSKEVLKGVFKFRNLLQMRLISNSGSNRARNFKCASLFTTRDRSSDFEIPIAITPLIIYMKKLLDSDWLRAVQFKCNTSAKSVTPVQKV